jgi:hypothetical protein
MGDDDSKTKSVKSHESTILYPVTLHSPGKEVNVPNRHSSSSDQYLFIYAIEGLNLHVCGDGFLVKPKGELKKPSWWTGVDG